ncbi:Unannotated, partial [Lentimonas sp. CC11]
RGFFVPVSLDLIFEYLTPPPQSASKYTEEAISLDPAQAFETIQPNVLSFH